MSDDHSGDPWQPPPEQPTYPPPPYAARSPWTAPTAPAAPAAPTDPGAAGPYGPPSYGMPGLDNPGGPPPRRRNHALIWTAVVVAVALVLSGAAAGLWRNNRHTSATPATASGSPSGAPSASPTTQASPTAPSTAGGPGATGPQSSAPTDTSAGKGPLDGYLLAPTELGPDTAMILLDNGRSATDQATLDFCNVTYKSETSRTTRVQVDYANAGQSASNEVVRYRAGGAASAFAEIQAAAKTCPTTYTTGQTTIGHIQRASKISGLVANQLVLTFAASFALSTGGSITNWSTAVYQFDGDFFSGVYVFGSDRAAVLKTATDLGAKAAKHLAEAVSGAPGTGGGPFSAPGPAAGSSDGTQV